MPQTTFSAYDTAGQTKLTDLDQLAEQRRREMQDMAFRGALVNNQNSMQREGWDRQHAERDQSESAQERIAAMNNDNQLKMNGSYGDRASQALTLADRQMGPAMEMARLERDKNNEGAALRDSAMQLEIAKNHGMLGLFNDAMGGGGSSVSPTNGVLPRGLGQQQGPDSGSGEGMAAPVGGASMGGITPQQRMLMFLSGKDPSGLDDPRTKFLQQAIAQAAAARIANGEIDPSQYEAIAKGDYSSIPRKEVSAISPEMQASALESHVSDFGERDTGLLSSDPKDTEIQDILRQRDQLAQAMKIQKPGLTMAQAIEGANFTVEQKIAPFQNRWRSDQINKLKTALRGGFSVPAAGAQAGAGTQQSAANNYPSGY